MTARVVIDTNALVSAALKAGGSEASVLDIVAVGRATWCVSTEILAEYRDVLHRSKFDKIPRAYIEALLAFAGRAELVSPTSRVSVSPDDADNRLLECAEAAAADYLVTGNLRHFPLRHGVMKSSHRANM